MQTVGASPVLVGVESLQRGIEAYPQGHQIEQVTGRGKNVEIRIAATSPSCRIPDETDAHIQATLDVPKRLRSMSPDSDAIYYFKQLSGQPL